MPPGVAVIWRLPWGWTIHQVDAGCRTEASVPLHIGLFRGLPEWIHNMTDFPQSKWSQHTSRSSNASLRSRLRSTHIHFCCILLVMPNRLFHCVRKLYKYINTRRQESLGPSWKLPTHYWCGKVLCRLWNAIQVLNGILYIQWPNEPRITLKRCLCYPI